VRQLIFPRKKGTDSRGDTWIDGYSAVEILGLEIIKGDESLRKRLKGVPVFEDPGPDWYREDLAYYAVRERSGGLFTRGMRGNGLSQDVCDCTTLKLCGNNDRVDFLRKISSDDSWDPHTLYGFLWIVYPNSCLSDRSCFEYTLGRAVDTGWIFVQTDGSYRGMNNADAFKRMESLHVGPVAPRRSVYGFGVKRQDYH